MDGPVFQVTQEDGGGLVAECLTESIVTQASNGATLRGNVREAVAAAHFDSLQKLARIHLHHLRDEVIA